MTNSQFKQGHACIIGVGADLPTTVEDTRGLARILKDPERCAYPAQQVHLLVENTATRQGIIATLERLAETTDADSTVLVYFSGHGYQLTKPLKSYFLMPYGYNVENLSETAISGSELVDLLREIPAKKLLLLLDCCHAGGLTDVSGFQIEKAPLPPEAQRMFAKGGGRMIIGSSRLNEKSLAGQPYSAFTYALLKGLCGKGASKEDGYVRATDLAMYASQVVPDLTGDKQHPVLDIEKADNFVLAYYAAGKPVPKGLPADLESDSQIESEPGQLNGNASQTVASGDRSVAVGGNVTGSTIISGDGNIVGDTNVTQNVTQRGKYNINMREAKDIHIGDTYDTLPSLEDSWQASPSSEKGIQAPEQLDASSSDTSYVEVPVFFATDRQQRDTSSVKRFYGGRRNSTGHLEYGIAKVSIPEDHRMGEIERPQWWRLEFREDPEKHVVLSELDVIEENDFVDTLRSSVESSKEPDLLLFIHGYNTSFDAAAMRTAQIAYDLQFPGPAILYSWPSEAKIPLYTSDENNIDWTIPHFQEFLNLLLTAVGASQLNTIAHSMGNRVVTRAIESLDYDDLPEGAAKLRNVIFAAPDIDADTFKQFARKFKGKADRLTLYASSNDKALKASKAVHGGYPRAGDSGGNLVLVDGVDTIDASAVDTSLLGHSYFGDNRSIISDIFYLIQRNLPPNQRLGLKSNVMEGLYYWLFKP